MRPAYGLLLAASFVTACAPDVPAPDDEEEEIAESTDDELAEPGFDRNRLLSDEAFVDASAMTESEIQAFLNETPYGNRSALASYTSGGLTAARAISTAAQTYRLNPLLILTRAQMEQSLIGKSTAGKTALDFAFGCGCPDFDSCSEAYRGFHKQVDCMAKHMRSYLDDLDTTGATIAGWGVGKAKKTLDPSWVTPKNNATAALYTYTPWVGTSGSGNLGHFKIWKKFASYVGYLPTGPGGCPAVGYPSGLVAQSLPSPAMTEAYTLSLVPIGLASADVPSCFLDPAQLIDPSTEARFSASSKVSSNFAFSELIVGEPSSRQVVVDPELVKKLQSIRSKVGAPVVVVDAFRSPERHLEECTLQCEETLDLTVGRAAIIESSAGTQKLLQAAAASGVGTCFEAGGEVYVGVGATTALGCPIASP